MLYQLRFPCRRFAGPAYLVEFGHCGSGRAPGLLILVQPMRNADTAAAEQRRICSMNDFRDGFTES
jgi:hypothetical protein